MAYDARGLLMNGYDGFKTKYIHRENNGVKTQYQLSNNGLYITHKIMLKIREIDGDNLFKNETKQEKEITDKLDVSNLSTYIKWIEFKQEQARNTKQDNPNLQAWTMAFAIIHAEPFFAKQSVTIKGKKIDLSEWKFDIDIKDGKIRDGIPLHYYLHLDDGDITNPFDLDSITYNQALFTILGLSPFLYPKLLKNKKEAIFNVEPAQNEYQDIDNLLLTTKENLSLECFNSEIIPTQEFLAWAVDKGFLTKLGVRKLKPAVAEKLHKLLTDGGFITGGFDDKWQWKKQRNQLTYLAKQLKQKHLLGDNCHSDLSVYIQDLKPDTKKPLKNVSDPAAKNRSLIDEIINTVSP